MGQLLDFIMQTTHELTNITVYHFAVTSAADGMSPYVILTIPAGISVVITILIFKDQIVASLRRCRVCAQFRATPTVRLRYSVRIQEMDLSREPKLDAENLDKYRNADYWVSLRHQELIEHGLRLSVQTLAEDTRVLSMVEGYLTMYDLPPV